MAHGSIFKICHSMIWDGRALFKKNVCLVKDNFGLVIETWVSGLSWLALFLQQINSNFFGLLFQSRTCSQIDIYTNTLGTQFSLCH